MIGQSFRLYFHASFYVNIIEYRSKSSFNILWVFLFSLKEYFCLYVDIDKFGVRLYRRCLKGNFFLWLFLSLLKIYYLCDIVNFVCVININKMCLIVLKEKL